MLSRKEVVALIIFLIILFWQQIFSFFSVPEWNSFIIQIVAVILGILGGLFVSKYLERDKSQREAAGILEAVDAEIETNKRALEHLTEAINSRPSLANRGLSTEDAILDMILIEKQFIKQMSNSQLKDSSYVVCLPILSKIDNRRLFESIINSYIGLRNVKVALSEDYKSELKNHKTWSHKQKLKFINDLDQSFIKELLAMQRLVDQLENTNTKTRLEVRALLKVT